MGRGRDVTLKTLEPKTDSMPQQYKDWKFLSRVTYEDAKVVEYSIHFYRERGSGDWYDEIRYDSHEARKGHLEIAPTPAHEAHVQLPDFFNRADWKNLTQELVDRDTGVSRKKPVEKR